MMKVMMVMHTKMIQARLSSRRDWASEHVYLKGDTLLQYLL